MFKILDVITIGSATRDVFLKSEGVELRNHLDSPTGVEQCFPLGSKIEVKEVVFTTGGGGTNAAVTFSKQGLKTGWVGVVGDDFNGKEIIKELKREKVRLFFTTHKDDYTAYSVILVHPNAERTILSYKGEGQHFDLEEIKWKKLKAKWFFLGSLGGNLNLLERAFEYITARNFKIAFNPGGKELAHGLEKLKPYLAEVDVFSVNKEEGEALLNSKFKIQNSNEIQSSKSKTAEEILKELSELVKGIVVLTLGPEGVFVSDKKNIYRAGTPDSPRVERTGAGDAFNSGFVAQMIKQNQPEVPILLRNIEDPRSALPIGTGSWKPEAVITSIQFATANASSVVSQYGPKAGILKKDDWGPWELAKVEIF